MLARIFFDLDGPILDVAERHHRVYADSVRELGGTPVTRSVFWEAKRQKTSERTILQQSGLASRHDEAFQRLKLERIESETYLGLDVVQAGVLPVLKRLQKSYSLILVTLRNSRRLLEWELNGLGLMSIFNSVLSGRETDKAGWQIKRDLICGAFSDISGADWIIGDTETDILAGQHLKIRTVAVVNGIRSEALLRSLKPDCLLPSAADFLRCISDTGVSAR